METLLHWRQIISGREDEENVIQDTVVVRGGMARIDIKAEWAQLCDVLGMRAEREVTVLDFSEFADF